MSDIFLATYFIGNEMNKDLHLLNLIQLETELENAIGYRDHFLQLGEITQFHVWDMEVESLVEKIKVLGDL